jgi:tetratricopeptide (TPR) repeat protein
MKAEVLSQTVQVVANPKKYEALLRSAEFAYHQGKYGESEYFLQQTVELMQTSDLRHSQEMASVLSTMAFIYCLQDRYSEAEPLYLQALKLRESLFGRDHTLVADTLTDLAQLYRQQGRSIESDILNDRAIAIREKLHWAFKVCHRATNATTAL